MNEGPGAAPVASQAVSRFGNLIARARQALAIERVWPLLWLPASVVLVFLTLSWFGLWLDLSAPARMFGRRSFCCATGRLVLAAGPVASAHARGDPGRIDRDTGLGHSPAHALVDTLAIGTRIPAPARCGRSTGGGRRTPSAICGSRRRGPICPGATVMRCVRSRFWRLWRAPSWRAPRSERGSLRLRLAKACGSRVPRPASMAGSIHRSIREHRRS